MMKKVITIALFAFFAAQGCKKCADCSGYYVGVTGANGQAVQKSFEYCEKKNPYSIENDTVYVDSNSGVDGVPGPNKMAVYVTNCR